jgi:hypothetical protein
VIAVPDQEELHKQLEHKQQCQEDGWDIHRSVVTMTITTGIAGALNLLIVLVISFVVMPRINSVAWDTIQAKAAAEKTRELFDDTRDEIKFHRTVIERLNKALDAAEAKAKKLEEDRKGKKP